MTRPALIRCSLTLAALLAGSAGLPAAEVTFLRDVKPILVSRCYRCHSSLAEEGGLRLDSAAAIKKGGETGVIFVAGKSGDSRLMAAVMKTGDLQMPPEGDPLTPEQIGTLRSWIDAGAKLPSAEEEAKIDHWSFTSPVRPELSPIADSAWSNHPLDRLVAAKHAELKLTPVGDAPKNLLLRRIYLDLIGLPPTPAELQAFLADDSPQAYEKVVDQLLASSKYGERWGRHWMDVWRYSDWDGYGKEIRESKPHIWRWRDWIVESLNADRPYDQMLVDMLAADELAPDDPQRLRATGFLVRNWYKFNRHTWLDNTIEHTGKAFLGVTFNCARCHDHMYDPLSQQEYYQLRAFFEPLEIRTDRVPGQADVNLDGLVRVYDAKAETPTYLFTRGNDKDPVKEKPLPPQTPRVFRDVPFALNPVSLPNHSVYPGLQKFVRDETESTAQAELAKSYEALKTATSHLATVLVQATQLPDTFKADPPSPPQVPTAIADAELQRALAEKAQLAAEANLLFVRARLAADVANYSSPPAANAKELALAAGAAERMVALAAAEKNLVQLEINLLAARRAKKIEDAKSVQAVAAAETAVLNGVKAIDAARVATTQPHENYTRLTPLYPANSTGRRLALAKWITDKKNPLTARVAVNHIWLRHFGSPLVPTMFDLGMNGKPATNQPLLDWLAVELMDSGWKMKHVHRLIVTSRTYRLHSAAGEVVAANKSIDPDNLYYWRANPKRMEAEVVRDATLSLAGSLDLTLGGPDLDPAQGFVLPRRSLYFRNTKEKKMTFLAVFDSPNVVECYRRSESIAPQQALAMSNSPLSLAQARLLAKKLSEQHAVRKIGSTEAPFIAAAFECVLCREPTADELQTCEQFLLEQATQLADQKTLTAFSAGTVSTVAPAADPRQRARENLMHVLLNHNDFVTIR
ncbi:Planctomycete cytochrome C [Anatilimnocola aggregata]|uniref:Planctomycete cytochrome C n=1 Tax=Anatilimnocola aggregata TaxID=2528021 RepID=A0A517YHD4_9BACT|nr:PSD1 and planctomycete cytochrome C domain-containing protein [Anatilimnocola aggregata]QDU29634.1 Planctomycete cytochrome C [Anatilimnocola aggregata]